MISRIICGGVLLSAFCAAAQAASFETIRDPICVDQFTANLWRTGSQYLDPSPNNGIQQDQWFMLARWQGPRFVDSAVTYNVGDFTSLYTNLQRGTQPQSTGGSGAVQASCYDVGMLINTWSSPHRPIVGGGYNDMWGYSFSAGNRPRPFTNLGLATDLVLQANIGVPIFSTSHNQVRSDPPHVGEQYAINGQNNFFAYLRDTTHPDYPPIAIVLPTHMSNVYNPADPLYDSNGKEVRYKYLHHGAVGVDYGNSDTVDASNRYSDWVPPGTSGSGVWFVSAPVSTQNDQRYFTLRTYYEMTLEDNMPPHWAPTTTSRPFWRVHITPTNMYSIATDINGKVCDQSVNRFSDCPARPVGGYSTDPNDWVLEYAGVIAEARLQSEELAFASPAFDTTDPNNWTGLRTSPIYNDTSKDQVSMSVHLYAAGIYRYYP